MAGEPKPHVSTRLRVSLFWLGKSPLVTRKDYLLKLAPARVPVRVEQIHRVIDASRSRGVRPRRRRSSGTKSPNARSRWHGRSRSTPPTARPTTGRFVIVDNFEISGGGIVREALSPTSRRGSARRCCSANYKWEPSGIAAGAPRRALQPAAGRCSSSPGTRTRTAKGWRASSKRRLFDDGRLVYFLGIGNVLYGVDADIERTRRRIAWSTCGGSARSRTSCSTRD